MDLRERNAGQQTEDHNGAGREQRIDAERRDHEPLDAGGLGHGVGGAHEPLHDPRLPSDFGDHPNRPPEQ